MATVIVTVKLMPESADISLADIQKAAEQAITAFGAEPSKADIEPVAFGLKALNLIFVMDEAKGSTEPLEAELAKVPGVASVQVTDVRRTLG